MPNLANITVKKADDTTDVVYTAITGSAGDKSPAVWKAKDVGTTPAENPSFTLVSAANGTGTSRRLKFSYAWPTTKVDGGGNVVISGRASFEGSGLLPQNMPQASINEVVHQFTNLISSALARDSFKDGYAPR